MKKHLFNQVSGEAVRGQTRVCAEAKCAKLAPSATSWNVWVLAESAVFVKLPFQKGLWPWYSHGPESSRCFSDVILDEGLSLGFASAQ